MLALEVAAATLAIVMIILSVIYPDRCVGTGSRPGLPGPRGLPCIGNLIEVWRNRRRMVLYMKELGHVYGPLCTLTVPVWGRIIVINRPEWLAHVKKNDINSYTRGSVALSVFNAFPGEKTPVASEGAEWRQARKAIQPIFTIRSFQNHLVVAMNEIMDTTVKLLSSVALEERVIDFNDLAGRMALSIFCKSFLGREIELLQEDIHCLLRNHPLVTTVTTLNDISAARLFDPYWAYTELFDGTASRFKKNISELWEIIQLFVKERIDTMEANANLDDTDFLTTLLENTASRDPLFLRNIMVTLLFAGRDNTQASSAWALYELSRNPYWMNRMRNEALELDKSGQVPSFSTLSSYPVHLAVFYETIRLWPGLPKNARFSIEDDVLPAIPAQGLPEVHIPKGTYVLWSDYCIMRDQSVWGPDADSFNPGRHLSPEGTLIKPAGPEFVSFGAGPRYCPAAQFVPYQWVSIWSSLLRNFDFQALDTGERLVGDWLTNTMTDPFVVKIRKLNLD